MTLLWFLLAAAPSFLHALSNLIDQYVIRKHVPDSPFSFLGLSGFICVPLALMILPFIAHDPLTFDISHGLRLMIIGVIFSLCVIPYFYAMKDSDSYDFTAVFMAGPVFVLALGWVLLDETITVQQMIGGAIIIVSATATMIDLKHWHFKARPFFLILLCIFIYAIFVVAVRAVALNTPWLVATYWMCLGWATLSILILIFVPNARKTVTERIQTTRGGILIFSSVQEVFDVMATASRTAALGFIAVPAALTDVVSGIQPFFALLFGYFAAKWLPDLYRFDLTRQDLLYKLGCLVILLGGLWLMVAS